MTPERLRRTFAALAGASLFLILLPVAVLAHAELDTISPADKSSGPAPQQIVGTFIQNLDPAKSNFRIVNAANSVVAEGGEVDSTNPRRMTLSLSPLAPGAYTIRWTTVSTEDGELDRGETTFTVVAAPPSPSVTPIPSASVPSASPSTATASAPPSVAPSPSPSGGTGTSTSTTDALIPILAVLVILALLGLWLLRGRGRRAA